jgi:hypothetical protein
MIVTMSFPIHLLTPSSSQLSTLQDKPVLNVTGKGLQAPGFATGKQRRAVQLEAQDQLQETPVVMAHDSGKRVGASQLHVSKQH